MTEKTTLETIKAGVPKSEWEWFGNAAHFICGHMCRFHMATKVGDYLVSTVGEMWPDSEVREIYASTRGIALRGKGDARAADYMKKIGYEEIGYRRKFETMVFRAGPRCTAKGCKCGMPCITGHELESDGYNDAGSATIGHNILCDLVATAEWIAKAEATHEPKVD
jgi:hypothetical protein